MSNWAQLPLNHGRLGTPENKLSSGQIGCLVIVSIWGLTALLAAVPLLFASLFFPPLFLVFLPHCAACALSLYLLPSILFANEPMKLIRLSSYFTLGSFHVSAIAFWTGPLYFMVFVTIVGAGGYGSRGMHEEIFWNSLPYFVPLVAWYAVGFAGHVGALKGRLFT